MGRSLLGWHAAQQSFIISRKERNTEILRFAQDDSNDAFVPEFVKTWGFLAGALGVGC
jgi:hypothetical protein